MTRTWLLLLTFATLTGCGGKASSPSPPPPPTSQPSVASARPPYWLKQPAVAGVEAKDFEALWRACEESARHFGFTLDRVDFRNGVITTLPLTSKQFFELWRNDVATGDDLTKSSLATYRRTLRFDVEKNGAGGYVASPKVVIERFSRTEQPITSSVYLRHAFRTNKDSRYWGTRETDRGITLPRQYWYATGRDEALEKNVAREVEKRLARS